MNIIIKIISDATDIIIAKGHKDSLYKHLALKSAFRGAGWHKGSMPYSAMEEWTMSDLGYKTIRTPRTGTVWIIQTRNVSFGYTSLEDFEYAMAIPEFKQRKTAKVTLQMLLDNSVSDLMEHIDIYRKCDRIGDLRPFVSGNDWKDPNLSERLLALLAANSPSWFFNKPVAKVVRCLRDANFSQEMIDLAVTRAENNATVQAVHTD